MEGPSFPQNRNIWTFCWAQDMVCPTVRVMCRNFFPRLSCPQFFLCCRCCCQLALRLKVSSHFFPACLSTFLSLCVCVSLLMFNFFVFSLFLFFYVQREFCRRCCRRRRCLCIFSDCDRFFFATAMYAMCVWVGGSGVFVCVWVLLLLCFCFC